MIRRVRFENFKALRDVSIDLEPLTLLLGANASGKTSVLEGLDYLPRTLEGLASQRVEAVGFLADTLSASAVRSFRASDNLVISGDFDDALQAKLTVPPEASIQAGANASLLRVECSRGDQRLHIEFKRSGAIASSGPRALLTECVASAQAVLLRLDPVMLERPCPLGDPEFPVHANGFGLAAMIVELKLASAERFLELEDLVRQVIPSVAGIVIEKTLIAPEDGQRNGDVRPSYGFQLAYRTPSNDIVRASHASDGTLIATALLALVSSRPGLWLMDDIERGLHPLAQGELMTRLRSLLAAKPTSQIIATSHSPYLLDHVNGDEVRLTALAEDGTSLWRKLTDHPQWTKLKDDMTAGEFWSTFGEDWLRTGQTP